MRVIEMLSWYLIISLLLLIGYPGSSQPCLSRQLVVLLSLDTTIALGVPSFSRAARTAHSQMKNYKQPALSPWDHGYTCVPESGVVVLPF